MNPKSEITLFFDGVCGLCSAWVDFVMQFDQKQVFVFSPLQSDYAKRELPLEHQQELSTVVVKIQGKIYVKSDAILKIFEHLGGAWSFFSLGRYLPRSLRDGLYDFVARHRYAVFGKRSSCRLPSEAERQRFRL